MKLTLFFQFEYLKLRAPLVIAAVLISYVVWREEWLGLIGLPLLCLGWRCSEPNLNCAAGCFPMLATVFFIILGLCMGQIGLVVAASACGATWFLASVEMACRGKLWGISAESVNLIPFSPEHFLALIDGQERFEKCFGIRAADGLRNSLLSTKGSPAWLTELRVSAAADSWVHGFAILHRKSNSVIGIARFKGPPDDDGMVEIAYRIEPAYQRFPCAREVVAALVGFALANSPVRLVRAHTPPTPSASTRILAKCGFKRVGEVVDAADETVWRWECALDPD